MSMLRALNSRLSQILTSDALFVSRCSKVTAPAEFLASTFKHRGRCDVSVWRGERSKCWYSGRRPRA